MWLSLGPCSLASWCHVDLTLLRVCAQAAVSIANAASRNAHDEAYSSPYSREAQKQGMDIPWWDKLLGAKIKDGKPQLAQLVVSHTSNPIFDFVADTVGTGGEHLCAVSQQHVAVEATTRCLDCTSRALM